MGGDGDGCWYGSDARRVVLGTGRFYGIIGELSSEIVPGDGSIQSPWLCRVMGRERRRNVRSSGVKLERGANGGWRADVALVMVLAAVGEQIVPKDSSARGRHMEAMWSWAGNDGQVLEQ